MSTIKLPKKKNKLPQITICMMDWWVCGSHFDFIFNLIFTSHRERER